MAREFPAFVRRLRGTTRPSSAFLFGSRIRGTASYMSDYDVLLITGEDLPRAELRARARDHGVDLFVIRPDEAEVLLEQAHTILLDALTEGRVLYDDLGVSEKLRRKCAQVIERRGIRRTPEGWMPRK